MFIFGPDVIWHYTIIAFNANHNTFIWKALFVMLVFRENNFSPGPIFFYASFPKNWEKKTLNVNIYGADYLQIFKHMSSLNSNFGTVLCNLCDPRKTTWFFWVLASLLVVTILKSGFYDKEKLNNLLKNWTTLGIQ